MSYQIAEQPQVANPQHGSRARNDLVGLASPVYDLIMRIQAGMLVPSKDMREKVYRNLREFERHAAQIGYSENQTRQAKFALAAFVDEAVLLADFPLKHEWEKYPLQLEFFGEHLAGVKFYDRLEELMKRPDHYADVIEVFYMCLLLGYKGRYAIDYGNELPQVVGNVQQALRSVGRLSESDLAPHWRQDDQPVIAPPPGVPLWLKLGGAGLFSFVLLAYMFFFYLLGADIKTAKEQLLR